MADEGRRDQLHPDREVFRPRGGVFLGKQDELIYAYLSDKRRFADLFNAGYFEGRTVVDPAQLEQVSERSQTTADLTEGAGAKMQIPRSYYRDIRMKRRDGAGFVIAAVENQAAIDYEMPCRIMRYDSNEYWKQIEAIHRKKREKQISARGRSHGYAEKMDKSDKLAPVYTMCFYHGKGPWSGPRSLKDMVDFEGLDESWQRRFQDYGIHIVCAADEQFVNRCHYGLREFLQVLNARSSKKKLRKLFQTEPFRNLDRDTAYAISLLADMPEFAEDLESHKNERGGYDMCRAMMDIRREERRRGMQKGRKSGMAKVNKLNELLIRNGRIEDLIKAAADMGYQAQLFQEYGL